MKIAIYGGAFDPPTMAHKAIVTKILENDICDRVMIVPCGNDHRFKKEIKTDIRNRLDMLFDTFFYDYSLRLSDRCSISDFELYNKTEGKMWELIKGIKKYEDIEKEDIRIIIGQDNADNIQRFYKGNDLVKKYKFITVKRSLFDCDPDAWYLNDDNTMIDVDMHGVSSTEARKKLEEIQKYIEPPILEHIVYNKLYNF
jgi:nicotinate-nucleotide adenylyltransferase